MAKWWPFGKSKPAKAGRMYAGAQWNRLTADWLAAGTSQDSETYSSLRQLRYRTRQLARDNDFVRNALRAIRNNVIGQGVGMQAQVKMQRSRNGKTLNNDLNEAIEESWCEWKQARNCHTAGVMSFQDIERLLVTSCAENGEVFIRLVRKSFGTSPVPLALEIIEADLLVDDRNLVLDDGGVIRMGVEKDKWQRPVAYWFYRNHPGDYLFQTNNASAYERVPADEVIHLFLTERPGQTRGIPWFASALKRLHHVAGFEEAEVIAARASSAIMGFIETPDGELQEDGVLDGQRVTDFSPGKIEALGPGEKFTSFTPTRPGGTFDPFMRAMLRATAAGVGVSYETLSKDYSQSNYSSSRLALLDDRDHYRVLQSWIIENFHQRVFEAWLDMAALANAVSLPGYELNPRAYRAVRWMPRGWSWVDPAREVQAYKEAVRCGFMTASDVVAQTGGDYEELLEQRQREVELADEAGLVFDTNPAAVDAKGADQSATPTDGAAASQATAPAEGADAESEQE